jgi:prepilin-type processing-associated H-X9-DG protein
MDSYGTRLHSWRTLILPYLNEKKLYDSIDLSKPWDDPVNAKALSEAPSVYRCPSMNSPPSDTAYLACAAANGCFRPVEPRRLSEIKDSLAETLLVIEVPADLAVHWASPSDADEQLIMSIGADSKTAHTGGMNAALCDGAVRFLSSKTPPEVWRALISIAGGDKPGDF